MGKRAKLSPVFWSSLIFITCAALAFYVARLEQPIMEASQIPAAQTPLGPSLFYFLAVAVVTGVVLALIPISKLKVFLRLLFAFLFCWGMFIIFGFSLPLPLAIAFSVIAGSMWFFKPMVWLHNALLVFTLASVGSVFGFLFSPFNATGLLFSLSIYDILAVRLGYMMWLVKKLSQSDTLPAFVIPKNASDWNLNLKGVDFNRLLEDRSEREFSILGGGDIGFPLLLVVSVLFAYGLHSALIMSAFALAGIISAWWIQISLLKGEPLPALPPISFASTIGLMIVRFLA